MQLHSKRILMNIMILTPFLIGASRCQNCVPTLRSLSEVLSAAWRSEGNSVLVLKSDIKNNVGGAINLSNQEYPFDRNNDPSFYKKEKLVGIAGSTNLEHFKLFCGTTQDKPDLKTYIVFWSNDFWEGSKQSFTCGGSAPATKEIQSTLSAAKSFCVVSESAPAKRINRCRYGPRCDDGWRNGEETDVDCGGSECSKCRENKRCQSNRDCQNNNCLSGKCRTPNCHDRVKNGSETDVDCGGSCSDCANGRRCSRDSDCTSGNCSSGTCAPEPTCNGSPAGPSARIFVVLIKDARGCGGTFTAFANSLSDARGCAQTAGWITVNQMCEYWVHIETGFTSLITSPSEQDALSCAAWTVCANCNLYIESFVGCVYQ